MISSQQLISGLVNQGTTMIPFSCSICVYRLVREN